LRDSTRVIAILAFFVNPELYLFPMINRWQVYPNSGETWLMRRNDEGTVIISNLNIDGEKILFKSVRIAGDNSIFQYVISGRSGITEGLNIHGQPAIASIEPVPLSPWYLISTIEKKEINSLLKERSWMTIFMIVLLLSGSLSGIGYIWRKQRTKEIGSQLALMESIKKINRLYSVLSGIERQIVRIANIPELLKNICDIIISQGGFPMVWFGMIDEQDQKIRIVASAGAPEEFSRGLDISLTNDVRYPHPAATAIKTCKPVIRNDIVKDPFNDPWRKKALLAAFRSAGSFPLITNNKCNGVLNLYTNDPGFFNEDELNLLNELAMNISLAMDFRDKEGKLKESEYRYRSTLDKMMEGCQIIDREWRYVYLNDVAVTNSRKEKNKLIGRTMMECFPGIEKTSMFETLQDSMENRTLHEMKNEFTYEDGSKAWFELYVQPVPEGIFILSLDVTQRKLAESRLIDSEFKLKEAQKLAHIGNWERDLLANTTICSAEIYRIYEVSSNYIFDYENNSSFVVKEDIVNVVKKMSSFYKGNSGDFEFRIEVKGKIKWLKTTVKAEKDRETGKVVKLTGITQDITLIKAAEEEVRKLNDELEIRIVKRTAQLEEANKELESFAYSVSHDLRAPLRSVVGFSQAFKNDYSPLIDEEGNHLLNRVVTNAEKMNQLIDDILKFSKTTSEPISSGEIVTGKLVQEILQEIITPELQPRIRVRTDNLENCTGDQKMLRQVWFNLISNAVKYSGKKDIIRIHIGSFIENNDKCYFVKDNGQGFDIKYYEKLFNVFQRLHSSNDFEGTGIGLALVKRIIKRHGGKVWAESVPEQGATFYFSLPGKL
jgi:PAS domain S-box-containing protein